jgi:hypothetical protein
MVKQSEETILPEDEEEDSMAMNELVTPAIPSPLPVRSGTSYDCFMFTLAPPFRLRFRLGITVSA